MKHHNDDIQIALKGSLPSKATDIISDWLLADYLGSTPEGSRYTTPDSLTTKAS